MYMVKICNLYKTLLRSELLRGIETMSYSPMLLSGVTTQKQWLTITYLEDYSDNIESQAAGVTIEILSTYIQIYSAKLQIHPQLFGLKSVIYHHPWATSTVGILSALSVNIFCFIFIKFNLASVLVRRRDKAVHFKEEEEETESTETEEDKKNK